jgi:hypothetical protein
LQVSLRSREAGSYGGGGGGDVDGLQKIPQSSDLMLEDGGC